MPQVYVNTFFSISVNLCRAEGGFGRARKLPCNSKPVSYARGSLAAGSAKNVREVFERRAGHSGNLDLQCGDWTWGLGLISSPRKNSAAFSGETMNRKTCRNITEEKEGNDYDDNDDYKDGGDSGSGGDLSINLSKL